MRVLRLVSLVVFAANLQAAEQWIKLSTMNFDLYTTVKEKKARETIEFFEQINDFFTRTLKASFKPDDRVCIVGFPGLKQSRPYRLSEQSVAHYLRTPRRRYIVMGQMSRDSDPVAVHEFIHLFVDRSEIKIPRWLNEGLAEFYSTIRPTKDKVIIGELPEGRLNSLRYESWLKLEDLVDPSRAEEFYHDRDRTGSFYAQSWLLTHMLSLSDDYRERFGQFVNALHNGSAAAEAFESVYSLSLPVVEGDLRRYLQGNVFVAKLDAKMEGVFSNPQVASPDRLEVELLLMDLLHYGPAREEAKLRAAALESEFGGDYRLHEFLGYHDLHDNNHAEARRRFQRACELGSSSAAMRLDYAALLQMEGAPGEEILAVLEEAVRREPENFDARYRLGMQLAGGRRFREALLHLGRVKQVTPDRAVPLFTAMALGLHEEGRRKEAEIAARRALEYAKEPAQTRSAQQILEYVTQADVPGLRREPPAGTTAQSPDAPPALTRAASASESPSPAELPEVPAEEPSGARLEGTFEALECRGQIAIVRIKAQDRIFLLAIYEPEKVQVRGVESAQLELACGPQNSRPVAVTYDPIIDRSLNTIGAVRAIELR